MSERVRGGAIPGFGLRRPVTTAMMFAALLVLGAIAYRAIPVELVPSGFTPPFLYVEVPTLRSSPADIEDRVALPLEEMLGTVRNLERLGTRIRSNRVGFMMEFADGTDMDVTSDQVRDRLERVLPTIDDDVGPYYVWKYNPSDDPVVWFAVTFDDVDDPGNAIEELVVPRLERQPGVSRVEAYGLPQRVVAVELDDRRVEAAGVDIGAVVQRLSNDNFALAAGDVREDGRVHPVRVVARYANLDDIRAVPIGNGLRLEDVGEVRIEDRAERAVYRVDRRPSIFLAVYKESTANTVQVSRAVHDVVEGELREVPGLDGADYHFFFDQGTLILESIGNLQQTAMWGGVFAIVVLFFFLRRLGMTLLVGLAIPCSLLMTVIALYFAGRTLNVLSLTGLMLAVGMVVDNSIVVVESIQARRLAGESARRAAWLGAAEVALAILVATLTTVVVFLPMILMTGSETLSFYLSQIGFPVCVALIASLFVSLLFLPLAAVRGLEGRPPARVRTIEWLQRRYAAMLAWVLRRRGDALLLALAAFASIAIPAKTVQQTDQQEPNINDFRIFLNMPDELSWEEQVDVLDAYEDALWTRRDELAIDDLLVRMGGQWGRPQLRAFLLDPGERTLARDEIIERAQEALPSFPGVEHTMSWDAPTAGARNATTLRVVGPDSQRLAGLADEVARRLRLIDGVTSVRVESNEGGGREMRFLVDSDRTNRLGLSAFVVGATIDFSLRGRRVGELQVGERELPIVVEGDLSASDELGEIRALELPGPYDGVVLEDVTSAEVAPGYASIDREDRRTVVSIAVYSTGDDLEDIRSAVDAAVGSMAWPRGYALELGQRFEDAAEGAQERRFALLLAVTFVFLLMGVLFESVVLPLSILVSIPFAFTGVYWMLFATRTSLDMMAGVGLVILVGIVVNNAIVLVDLIEELRRRGVGRSEAIVEAGRQRLRPILMTAMTTIFGLVPMAAGTSALVGIPYHPMGKAVIGGLIASTVLTLFVVPLVYTLFDDLRGWGGRFVRALRAYSSGGT